MRAVVRAALRRRRADPARGPGDHRAQPQELLGLVLHRPGDPSPRALHGQDRALHAASRHGCSSRSARFPCAAARPTRRRSRRRASILRQGGVLALFPEGTRIRDPESLGEPRSGAGRLALETGAPLVPAAISGSERLFLGPLPKPRRVRISFGEPIARRRARADARGGARARRRRAVARGRARVRPPARASRPDRARSRRSGSARCAGVGAARAAAGRRRARWRAQARGAAMTSRMLLEYDGTRVRRLGAPARAAHGAGRRSSRRCARSCARTSSR